ncbi:MAG: hypothetical protein U5O39_07545 [Gammaproteobacteria bacterium]|nr:hypothetical protein [Gammaproteobacteria bacterium]
MCMATVILWFGQSAVADSSAVERCRQTADAFERIACLEAALEAQESPTRASPTKASPTKASPTDEKSQADADVSVEGTRGTEREEHSPPSAPAEDTASDLGAEQLRGEEEPAPAIARGLPVKEYSTVWYRRLQVHLENGQIWRQIEGDTQSVRANLRKNQSVDIEHALGGYKLHLNEMRRTIRVRRIQ